MGDRASFFSLLIRNLIICVLYWGLSHLNFLLFRRVGVLPMPVWPAAGIALIVISLWKKEVLPGVALGTVLANAVSLGAPIHFALCIAVMNTLGPYIGIRIIEYRLGDEGRVRSVSDFFVIFVSAGLLTPALTATGGIGFKLILGLMSRSAFWISWLKWFMAHSLGGLLIGAPFFAYHFSRRNGII